MKLMKYLTVLRNNIVAKQSPKLVLLLHKKTTKQVFLWPNIGQKSIKVLKFVEKLRGF